MIGIDLTGRRALITGATRGIGAQIADDFEALGAELLLTGTDPEAIDVLSEKHPSRTYRAVDFLDEGATHAFIEGLENERRIDILVNNAGINRISDIHASDVADWDAISKVNLHTPVLLTRTVSGMMRRNGYGRIVNISSIFGVVSKAKRSFYSTTKFGILGLTVASALDLAREGVLVNAVSPGFVLTDLTRRVLGEEGMAELADQVPIGRFAEPSEISAVVAFLASDLNTYITAQNLVVDGGFVSA